MIVIDDKKKKDPMQKKVEMKKLFRLQICYSYALVFITKISQTIERNEIVLIGVILYLIISVRNIMKIDNIKRKDF